MQVCVAAYFYGILQIQLVIDDSLDREREHFCIAVEIAVTGWTPEPCAKMCGLQQDLCGLHLCPKMGCEKDKLAIVIAGCELRC